MKEDNTRIFVATTKELNQHIPKSYIPVQAGSNLNKELPYLKDNDGPNISKKNPFYCELTVLYWVWKNQNFPIEGLAHYRRYFFNEKGLGKILSVSQIQPLLQKREIIIPKKISVGKSVESQYKKAHHAEDYERCREAIKRLYPEYLPYFDRSSRLPYLHPYNMFIAKKEILDDYCSFLFPLLEQLEQEIPYMTYDNYQRRVFGFLAERIFQVWILKHTSLDSIELPVYNTERSLILQKIKDYC